MASNRHKSLSATERELIDLQTVSTTSLILPDDDDDDDDGDAVSLALFSGLPADTQLASRNCVLGLE